VLKPRRELLAALGATRVDPDLGEVKEMVQEPTFQYEVPRAPICPSTLASGRAR
jgi:hypothetical protein